MSLLYACEPMYPSWLSLDMDAATGLDDGSGLVRKFLILFFHFVFPAGFTAVTSPVFPSVAVILP
jgi:hypothetical protein